MENGGSVYSPTTSPAEPAPHKGLRSCGCTAAHLGLSRLALKALQLVLSFLAFVLEEVIEVCTSCGGLYFFEFVSCSAFLLCIPILAMYCTSLHERVGKEQVKQLDFWIVSVLAIFFFLASVVFSATNDRTSIEIAAIVFGYLASITFIVDAVMIFRRRQDRRKETQQENTARTLNPAENQPLNNQPA
ncbi:CKLF-like MARVEL transmembrane domain-containing protein 6 [Eublepharis macularius]|uniref:CKLF-like MARVEL transmembrane domain-containing protein 6 n=1 Tax=Eublepharis macularius TaxID=481883 RepID=A0AA97K0D4_EUBMA|nr:CKLF-like MARVEL transmembrane domain-containing protein 6 [Eublepharis macularius]